MIRRLRRRIPEVPIILGCWMSNADHGRNGEHVKADAVVTTLHEGLALCLVRASAGEISGSHLSLVSRGLAEPALRSHRLVEAT